MRLGKFILIVLLCFAMQVGKTQISQNMNLLSTWQTGNRAFNDVWGYVDTNGDEVGIIGSRSHFYFVDISDPTEPELIDGFAGGNVTPWRDMKSYSQWAYGVCDNCNEGLSIFRLGDSPASNGVEFVSQTTSFFSSAHNIFVDEQHGRLYVIGSNTQRNGVIILDIKTNPEAPILLGAVNVVGGYMHDLYVRDHIGYGSSEGRGLYVYDFSNPNFPQALGSLTNYPQQGYNHSSWLNPAGDVLIMADETHNTSLKAVDVGDLSDIQVTDLFRSELLAPAVTGSIAHNPFVRDNYAVVSYYHDGVQVFDISNPSNVQQVAWYDTFASNTSYSGFSGCWGTYPFLPSGLILGSDGASGLFVLEPTDINFTPIPPIQPPFAFVNEDVSACNPNGTAVTLSLTTDGDVIQWFRDGNQIGVSNSITVTGAGTYTARVFKGPHSMTTDPIEIVFGDAPDVSFDQGALINLCGDEASDISIAEGADTYEWFLDGSSISTGTNSININTAGEYTVVASTNGCEASSEIIMVTQEELPIAELNFETLQTICSGDSIILESVNEATAYQWFELVNGIATEIVGETDSQLTVRDNGVFLVELNNGSCSAMSDDVAVNVSMIPSISLNTTESVNLCEGETLLVEPIITANTEPITLFEWFLDGALAQSANTPGIEITQTGVYELIGSTAFCQTSAESVSVVFDESPISEIVSSTDFNICNGETINLSSLNTADEYQWSFNGIELSGATSPNLIANLPGVYSLDVGIGDCTANSSITIQLTEAPTISTEMDANLDVCEGESVTLVVMGNAENVEWFKDGVSINIFDNEVTVSDAATYTLMASNGSCQAEPISFEVSITELPTVEIEPVNTNVLCPDGEITLTANTNADEFVWVLPTGESVAQNQETLVVSDV